MTNLTTAVVWEIVREMRDLNTTHQINHTNVQATACRLFGPTLPTTTFRASTGRFLPCLALTKAQAMRVALAYSAEAERLIYEMFDGGKCPWPALHAADQINSIMARDRTREVVAFLRGTDSPRSVSLCKLVVCVLDMHATGVRSDSTMRHYLKRAAYRLRMGTA